MRTAAAVVLGLLAVPRAFAAEPLLRTEVSVDAQRRFQVIDGFGVNVTPAQWREGALKPTLDMLVGDLGTSLVRLDCHGTASRTEDARLVEQKPAAGGTVRITVPEGSIFTLTTETSARPPSR